MSLRNPSNQFIKHLVSVTMCSDLEEKCDKSSSLQKVFEACRLRVLVWNRFMLYWRWQSWVKQVKRQFQSLYQWRLAKVFRVVRKHWSSFGRTWAGLWGVDKVWKAEEERRKHFIQIFSIRTFGKVVSTACSKDGGADLSMGPTEEALTVWWVLGHDKWLWFCFVFLRWDRAHCRKGSGEME